MPQETDKPGGTGERQAVRPTVRVYRPDNRYGDSAVAALRYLAAEVWRHRAHVALIFKRDFRAAYRGSRLGIFWNFVLPLLPISVYIFLSVLGVFPAVESLPRSVFVCLSMTLWLLFSGLVEQPIAVVQARNADAMRTSLPIGVTVASSFATLAFETLLRILLVAALMLAEWTPLVATAPLALLVIAVGAAFSLSIGLVCAVANIFMPDIRNIVSIVMRYGIFVSGVIFPLSAIGPLAWLEWLNPFAVFLQAVRDLMFVGRLQYPVPVAVLAVATVFATLFSARVFYRMEHKIRGVV